MAHTAGFLRRLVAGPVTMYCWGSAPPVAGAARVQTIANSQVLPDAPIAAVALPWALPRGRLDPGVETLSVPAEGARTLRVQAFVFHDVEGPAVPMVLPTDPERGADAPPAVACEPLDWLRGTVGTTRPDARFDALGGVVCLLGAMLATLRSRLLAGGFRTATLTFASARVLGPLLISAVGKCEGAAGAVARVVVVMRPKDDVDDEKYDAAEASMNGGMSRKHAPAT